MDDSQQSASLGGAPRKPEEVSELGVHKGFLEDLALKVLYLFGPFSLLELSRHMRLSLNVGDELFSPIANPAAL